MNLRLALVLLPLIALGFLAQGCVSVDPAPGFHFDSDFSFVPPATVAGEAAFSADVLQLGCFVIDLVGLGDNVGACKGPLEELRQQAIDRNPYR